METVVKAAEHVFNSEWFDKHIREEVDLPRRKETKLLQVKFAAEAKSHKGKGHRHKDDD